jgi:hypothetical protein
MNLPHRGRIWPAYDLGRSDKLEGDYVFHIARRYTEEEVVVVVELGVVMVVVKAMAAARGTTADQATLARAPASQPTGAVAAGSRVVEGSNSTPQPEARILTGINV